ncbi:hypothetical protein Cfor_10315 [Coptotermes formosanus]|uniref:tRNA-queuosine alpha-mannosyltransferase n=1 Tax=Coptotermes formosanus TaxID=36987 RepID=A0A6L2PSY1_COPFO|nr:hypothetical protein Cfor_10315 [Coptotermes formosanus]
MSEKRRDNDSPNESTVLLLEPFYGGSHKQLIDTLINGNDSVTWVLFASCILNLAELVALRSDLSHIGKIVYFHENQLIYPIRKEKDRDFQYGYNQILTCLVADIILFNSKYNQDSFLDSICNFLKLQPDFRPKDLKQQIAPKCRVLYFPIQFPLLGTSEDSDNTVLHLVWPHRWEHDKDPETFFRVLLMLADAGLNFRVSVLGESFSEVPPVFAEARTRLGNRVIDWGHQETKDGYYEILQRAHVAISTAKHEFYGVAMLEATYCGCFPLCPNALVYPELYPNECLYRSEQQLLKMLENFCQNPSLARHMRHNLKMDFKLFSADYLISEYKNVLLQQ